MTEFRELYQELILDHSKRPRNYGKMEEDSHKSEGFNPLCGDKVTLYLKVEDNIVRDVKFMGSGCAISMASASLMTETLKGKSKEEAEQIFELFHDLVTGKFPEGEEHPELGKLLGFAGVRDFPIRVKCATLAWHTMKAALEKSEQVVSTE